MSPKLSLLLLFLLLPAAIPAPMMAQDEKPLLKLGLIPEAKEKKEKEKDRLTDAEVLTAAADAFLAARRFKMIERDQLKAVFTEKSLQDFIGGKVNNKLTDVLDLDLIGVVGYTVETKKDEDGKPETTWIIDVRLIDVKTAANLATVTSERATLLNMLSPATPREAGELLAQSVREAFPPLGYIIQIEGKDIVIDLGSEAGLKKGDTLEVVQEGAEIIHPVTGQVLSAPLKVVGELKVVTASAQVANCKRTGGKEELKLASLVRLKGTESVIAKWVMKVPRLKDAWKKKKGEAKN
ncbi:MAG TPA: hypothetical protein VKK31_20105 [Thermoanaerobaculia bacterium]|nr:hypothetical protein [Thermoanaerobaculia bacterium]